MVRRTVLLGTVLTGAALVLASASLVAHHSISAVYDDNRRVSIDGVIAEFRFVQPHPFILVDVTDGGRTTRWQLELDNLRELSAIGITADTLKPKERITVSGSPGRTNPASLYVRSLQRPSDGFFYEQVGGTPRIRRRPS